MKCKAFILAIGVLLTFSAATATSFDISFRGLEVDEPVYNAGETLEGRANILNHGDGPQVGLNVYAFLQRESDNSVVFETVLEEDIDLASRELRLVEIEEEIPSDIPEGEYELIYRVESSSGIPVAFIQEEVYIENEEVTDVVELGSSGVYLVYEQIITQGDSVVTRRQPSYGTHGETVLPGSEFDIRAEIVNPGDSSVELSAETKIRPTYSTKDKDIREFEEQIGSLDPGEEKVYTLETSMNQPGTYEVETVINNEDGDRMTGGSVRLVIGGEGGSITEVRNYEDVYKEGEYFGSEVTIVGPADGVSTVENAFLNLEILKEDEVVISEEKTIDRLPFQPEDFEFGFEVPEDLEEYVLRIELGKDDLVFDVYEEEYSELIPDRVLTEDGYVRERGECVMDGVCTKQEYEMGCYDCRGVEEEPEKESYFVRTFEEEDEETEEPEEDDEYWRIGLVAAIGLIAVVLLGYKMLGDKR